MTADFPDLSIGYPEPDKSSYETPTIELRFFDGVLQQLWEVSEVRGGVLHKIVREWRDVPQEQSG